MRVFHNPKDVPVEFDGAVFAIGNFDGVHLGHQAVLGAARDHARSQELFFGVLTFEPHPRTVLRPDPQPFRLTPSLIKRRHFEMLGVDLMVEMTFNLALARVPAPSFVEDILVGQLGLAQIVVGWDFCFGKNREGNAVVLREIGTKLGFEVSIIRPVSDAEEEVYSSNLIREHLRNGQPASAAALLGHLWEIVGTVEKGEERGRTIGFPTANIALGDYLVPKMGVYAVRAGHDAGGDTVWRDGVANIGVRPTVGADAPLLELHLLDFDGDLYGQDWRVALVDFIRPEKKFDGLEALKKQIHADAREARQVLAARRIRAGSIGPDIDNKH